MSNTYHHGDLKAVLLAYAREQLENASLDGLSMREMAKAVGVSHTAAYRHFKDKQALLDAVAVQGFEDMQQACDAAVAAASSDQARPRLEASGLAYVSFGLRSPQLLRHMFTAVSQPQASQDLGRAGARLFERLHQLVVCGQQQGVFRGGDTKQLAHACWAMAHGLATLLSVGPLRHPQEPIDGLLLHARQSLSVFTDGMMRR